MLIDGPLSAFAYFERVHVYVIETQNFSFLLGGKPRDRKTYGSLTDFRFHLHHIYYGRNRSYQSILQCQLWS